MNVICKTCQKEFVSERSLHAHLKAHKQKVDEYYYLHYPHRDLFSGELIVFKNVEQYFNTYFNSKENMKRWFATADSEKVKEHAALLLKRYKEDRSQVAPCQVVLRSLTMPPVVTYHEVFKKPFHEIIADFGLQKKFSYAGFPTFKPSNDLKIFVDTREQLPLKFDCKTQINKLDCGDYCAADNLFSGVFVERKSLSDLISTISKGYVRFQEEIERAKQMEQYIVVVVESFLSQAVDFRSLSNVSFGKAEPHFIFHRIREILENFSNVQFVFVKDREFAAKAIKNILLLDGDIRNYDLQYCHDRGKICG